MASESLVSSYLSSQLAPIFIGMTVSTLLFGASIPQVYNYYQRFPNDMMILRASVACLWIVVAFNLSLNIHCVQHYLIVDFGDYLALNVVVWSLKLRVVTSAMIILMVHSLYAHRLWRFGELVNIRKMWLSRLILPVLVVVGSGISITLAVEIYKLDLFTDMHKIKWAIFMSLSATVSADSVIAGTMCHYLHGSRRSAFTATNSQISKLILWTVGTGLITSMCSLSSLIIFGMMPSSLMWLALEFPLAALYLNSLLSMLNSRKSQTPQNNLKDVEQVDPSHLNVSIPSTNC